MSELVSPICYLASINRTLQMYAFKSTITCLIFDVQMYLLKLCIDFFYLNCFCRLVAVSATYVPQFYKNNLFSENDNCTQCDNNTG